MNNYCSVVNMLRFLPSSNPDLKTIKLIFKFYKKKIPSLFLQKDKDGDSLLPRYLLFSTSDFTKDIFKYILKFWILYFPSLFTEKINVSKCHLNPKSQRFVCISRKYLINFFKYNFPETSKNTNNFILPLLMDIQN